MILTLRNQVLVQILETLDALVRLETLDRLEILAIQEVPATHQPA